MRSPISGSPEKDGIRILIYSRSRISNAISGGNPEKTSSRVAESAGVTEERHDRVMEQIFTEIFQANTWGSAESRSGPGSESGRALTLGKELNALLQRLQVTSIVDAPCGDFNWLKDVPLALESYLGIDIVEALIQINRREHSASGRTFIHGDISRESIVAADLILCRDCLVHFSFADIFRTLRNFKASGSNYLLTTTFSARHANRNIETGGWRTLNLVRAPFCFPAPLVAISDFCPDPEYADKRLGLWSLQELPL